jgi:hypothetical protein
MLLGNYFAIHSHLGYNIAVKARKMRRAGHVTRMGEKKNAYRLLVGKPEGRRPLGRPRRRWLDSIRMDLLEVGWDGVDWLRIGTDGELL